MQHGALKCYAAKILKGKVAMWREGYATTIISPLCTIVVHTRAKCKEAFCISQPLGLKDYTMIDVKQLNIKNIKLGASVFMQVEYDKWLASNPKFRNRRLATNFSGFQTIEPIQISTYYCNIMVLNPMVYNSCIRSTAIKNSFQYIKRLTSHEVVS